MSCYDLPGLLPIDQALERMLDQLTPVEQVEDLAITAAVGRITAEPVRARVNLPVFDNSAMDGYGLRHQDAATGKPLPVQARILAGQSLNTPLQPGHCVRIMTGAPLPVGCDTVVMQEHAQDSDQGVAFDPLPEPGANVRLNGTDLKQGDVVLPAGHRIRPIDVALLISVGLVDVTVHRRVRIAVFASGDELQAAGTTLAPGQIYDSNRPGLHALLDRLGVEVLDLGVIPDEPQALRQAFSTANETSDLVISSGGVSVGEADFTRDILAEEGDIEFWKLAIKPGKPLAFGRLSKAWFVGLPGNPVSTLVTFHLIAVPAIRRLMGMTHRPLAQLAAISQDALHKSPGRMDFQRGHWAVKDGTVQVRCTGSGQGSHQLSSLTDANCYIALEQERGPVLAGEAVTLWLFDDVLA
ncbi:gephyrin-like molybdotransferase Glp [Saccharospirillum impatiens]|uniref:molybdopterin molybdotransferase MoeA n=1 Tax=Saccharospirillum impatiens TaxID=169438 RepID=UPI000426169B|nr:gephyrin-like molybdotransferase Glp [Saccharospirillum impatiens]